ncbi:MAG: S8/S53 family peptidase [Propionibacteriaceae bacterium]
MIKMLAAVTAGMLMAAVGNVSPAQAVEGDPTTATAYNLGGSLDGRYTDAAGAAYDGNGKVVVVIDGAFTAGNSQFTDSTGQSKVAGEACIGQEIGATPWPSLCTPGSTTQPSWPGADPMYFSSAAGSSEPGNAPFNTCTDSDGGYCHNGHGTGSAGAVVGQPSTRNESDGRIHHAAGAAVGAEVYQIKVGGGSGTELGWPHASVVDALNWVNYVLAERSEYRERIAAINLSVSGGPLPDGSACPSAGLEVDEAAGRLTQKGIAVVMAAGNDGITGTGTWNCGSNIVRVGATNVTSDTLTNYTQRSSAIQLYAPVGDGTFASNNKIMLPYRDHGWWFVRGTSFAAPQVAGAYAVLREKFGAEPSVSELTALLASTGTPVSGSDVPAGSRVINIAAAVDVAP